jgi:hypothetical protein
LAQVRAQLIGSPEKKRSSKHECLDDFQMRGPMRCLVDKITTTEGIWAIGEVNPYQGIVTMKGLVGTLSTPKLSTLSTT